MLEERIKRMMPLLPNLEYANVTLSGLEWRIWQEVTTTGEPQRILLAVHVSRKLIALLAYAGHHVFLKGVSIEDESKTSEKANSPLKMVDIKEYQPYLLRPFLRSTLARVIKFPLSCSFEAPEVRFWRGMENLWPKLRARLEFDFEVWTEVMAESDSRSCAETADLESFAKTQCRPLNLYLSGNAGVRRFFIPGSGRISEILVSIIVIFYGLDRERWRFSLNSLRRQTLGTSFLEVCPVPVNNRNLVASDLEDWRLEAPKLYIKNPPPVDDFFPALKETLNAASGEFLLFLRADDMLRHDALDVLLKASHETGADVVRCQNQTYSPYRIPEVRQKRLRPAAAGVQACFESGHLVHPFSFLLRRESLPQFNDAFVPHPQFFYLPLQLWLAECTLKTTSLEDDLLWYIRPESICGQEQAEANGLKLLDEFRSAWHDPALNARYPNCLTEAGTAMEAMVHWLYLHFPVLKNAIFTARVEAMLRYSADSAAVVELKGAPPARPWELHEILSDSLVFVTDDVAYHLRNFVGIARALRRRGLKSHVLVVYQDRSREPKFEERAEMADIIIPIGFRNPKSLPLTPFTYIFIGDWQPFAPLIHYLDRHSMPYFGFYEGISDTESTMTATKSNVYKAFPDILVPGQFAAGLFPNQRTWICGLENVRGRMRRQTVFPASPLVVINLNFSYLALTQAAEPFLKSAMEGCRQAGIDFLVNQHPKDTYPNAGLPLSDRSIDEDLERATVIISRFSTVILEALALGKPIIYHDPHGEPVQTFKEPLGAYPVTHNTKELVEAIKKSLVEVAAGVDFRHRALDFLERHAAVESCPNPLEVAAEVIVTRLDYCKEKKKSRFSSPLLIPMAAPCYPELACKTSGSYGALFWAHQFYRIVAMFTRGNLRQTAVARRRTCANQRKAVRAYLQGTFLN